MTLELKDVSLQAGGETHIYPTSLSLVEHGFNVLLGTTLAGKTTLMQLMAGLEKPTSGEIWFNGRNVTGVPVQKRNVSMVYQQFINYPNLSVYENIASPLRVARLKRAEIETRVGRVAELLRLTPMLQAPARRIVRRPAAAHGARPRPRQGLPIWSCSTSRWPISTTSCARSCATSCPACSQAAAAPWSIATTEPCEALLLGGHTATMDAGHVTQFGPTGQIYREPIDLVTARVFSEPPINAMHGHEARQSVHGR